MTEDMTYETNGSFMLFSAGSGAIMSMFRSSRAAQQFPHKQLQYEDHSPTSSCVTILTICNSASCVTIDVLQSINSVADSYIILSDPLSSAAYCRKTPFLEVAFVSFETISRIAVVKKD
jgi:hypothetical protein